jgi:hypothetical protein
MKDQNAALPHAEQDASDPVLGSDVRTSHKPSPSARQSGIPTGQRY